MCCCCCGMQTTHISSAVLIILAFIFASIGLAGRGSENSWDYLEVRYNLGSQECKTQVNFGLEEFEGDFCSYQSFPTPQYVRLSMDTITYDSDDCKSNFCDPCENAGTGIDALLSLAIIGCLCALGVTYWRWLDTMSGNDVGCTTKRIVTSVVYTSVVLFLMISTSVWNECRDKIVQFGNDLTSKASAGSAEGESTLDVGWSMVTLAWITAVIAAGNRCCAVSPSPPPRANNQRTNARSAEGVVTATPVERGHEHIVEAVAVAPPFSAQSAPVEPAEPAEAVDVDANSNSMEMYPTASNGPRLSDTV